MAEPEQHRTSNQNKKVYAEPTKDFFIRMVTRDIALHDCIFDLLDNSIDGARRTVGESPADDWLAGYRVEIDFDSNAFVIRDNCGGIRLTDAIDYAFHFGRRHDAPDDVQGGIGLYGIGMKRAIFKMGTVAKVLSETTDECFSVSVDVESWQKEPAWDFEYFDEEPSGRPGATITVSSLHAGIAAAFGDPAFARELRDLIARDYAFFLARGLFVTVRGQQVPVRKYELRSGEELSPAVLQYDDGGVSVRLTAGLIEDLPEDIPDEIPPDRVERSGWFVVCNDRVVLAADKSERTVWGDDGFKVWHPQYNGFAGFVFFSAADQSLLPWTTTKRDLDASSPLYRRAVSKMKELTEIFTVYTNTRKLDHEAAKRAEAAQQQLDVSTLRDNQSFVLPKIAGEGRRSPNVTINYVKPRAEIEQIKEHIGDLTLSARDVGKFTYEFFLKVEMGK